MDPMMIEHSARFYQSLIERIAPHTVVTRSQGALWFSLMGAQLSLELENPHYFQLVSSYTSLPNNSTAATNVFEGTVDQLQFLRAANQMNLELGGPVKVIVGPSGIRFEICMFLFGSTTPARFGSLQLPVLTLGQIEPIANQYCCLLTMGTIPTFFQRVARRCSLASTPAPVTAGSLPSNPAGLAYFQRSFAELGVMAKDGGSQAMPEFVFAIDGFHFRMKAPPSNGWRFVMSVPFIEERRFDLNTTAANIIHGVLTEEFLYHCNRFNAENLGLKCGAFVNSGGMFLVAACDIPQLPREQFAQLLPIVWTSLLDGARKLF